MASVVTGAEPRVRVWPAVLIVGLMFPAMYGPSIVLPVENPLTFMAKVFVPMYAFLAVAVWWLFFSRISWGSRLLMAGAFTTIAGSALAATEGNFRFFGVIVFVLPWLILAAVVWLVAASWATWQTQATGLLAIFVLAFGWLPLVRMEGTTGEFAVALSWRWSPTAEQQYLASRPAPVTAADAPPALALQPGDWPAFRGPNRDGQQPGVTLEAAFVQSPPAPLWKQRVGPGWSSFCVVGGKLFTQEQRGENEAVVCYDAVTGKEVWEHATEVRFDEAIAGPGPRATPTFDGGKLYVTGTKGSLSCLDPATGKQLWTKNFAEDTGAKLPTWGFSSSPLVANGIVSVLAGGPDGKLAVGYKADTGDLAWTAGNGTLTYCSPQLATLAGVPQILAVSEKGVAGIDPTTGKVFWEHSFTLQEGMARCTQPAVVGDDVLVGTFFDAGTRRVHVKREGDTWTAEEAWTTKKIQPYYNDFVVSGGHLYGFSGAFLVCVNAADGKEKWRERGYGNGQVLLLPDRPVLLILSEKGEVALVEVNPAKRVELGRFAAIEGKTWNHPVIAAGKLFVRNGAWMACFPLTPGTATAAK